MAVPPPNWPSTPPETPGSKASNDTSTTKPRGKARYKVRFKTYQPSGVPYEKQLKGVVRREDWRIGAQRKGATERISKPVAASCVSSDRQNDECRDIELLPQWTFLPRNGTRMDPFTQIPIKGECVEQTLDYFLSVVMPKHNGVHIEGHMNPHISLLLPYAMKNAVLFESMMGLCRASILTALGQDPHQDQELNRHRQRTVAAVTDRLSTPDAVNDATILAVTMLLTLEYILGNVAAVAAHLGGLERMIAMRKDLNDDTPWKCFVKAGLDAYKALGSFITGKAPPLPKDSHSFIEETFAELSLNKPITYPKAPFSPDLCRVLSRLDGGFSELALSGMLSEQMLYVLASITATNANTASDWVGDTILDPELQAILSALQRLSLMRIRSIEKYLTSGLLAHCFQLRRLRALNLFHDPAIRSFIQTLHQHEKPGSEREQRCMMWVTMSIAGALSLRTIRMPGSHLVLDRAFELYPAFNAWHTLEPILRCFFWTEALGRHWRSAWDIGRRRWDHVLRARKSSPVVLPLLMYEAESRNEIEEIEGVPTMAEVYAHSRSGIGDTVNLVKASQCPFTKRGEMQSLQQKDMMTAHSLTGVLLGT